MYIYAEFKVEIRRGREGRHGHRVTVECEKPDGGRVGPTDAQPITTSVTRLIPAASAEQRIDLGEELGQCMFPPRVLAAFTETLRGLDAGTGIRVRLLCVDEEMARWPWELARIAVPAKARPRYLFRDERFSLVRTVIDHRPAAQPKERRKLVILTVDATKVLDDQELEPDFPEQLAHTAPLQRLDLSHPTRRTIDELIDQVVDGEDPLDIFHFTGHGRPPRDGQAGALVLYRDQDTGSEHYRGDELARQLSRAWHVAGVRQRVLHRPGGLRLRRRARHRPVADRHRAGGDRHAGRGAGPGRQGLRRDVLPVAAERQYRRRGGGQGPGRPGPVAARLGFGSALQPGQQRPVPGADAGGRAARGPAAAR